MNHEARSAHRNHGPRLGRTLATALLAGAMAACANSASSLAAGPLNDRVGGYELEVIADGRPVPVFHHRGESYVLGQQSDRYILRVHNRSNRRIEAVVSVDGIDVVDGKSASFDKRGYLVPAWGFVDIDGWRLNANEAAAFRFSSVGDSYGGKTGRARNVGVIGLAVFPERRLLPPPRPIRPYPYRPYGYNEYRDDDGGGYPSRSARKAEAESSSAADAPAAAPPSEMQGSGRGQAWSNGDRAKSGSLGAPAPRNRPGLGTEFGEAVTSSVQEVEFVRQDGRNPSAVLGMRYNDRQGLLALGIDVDGVDVYTSDEELRGTASPFPVSTRNRFARPPHDWNRY